MIGNVKLAELKVRDVDFALGKLAKHLSTRSVRLARMILIQAVRNAMVNDFVVQNVADLAAVPTGKPGRPSKSLNLDQALAVLDAAKGERLWPYVAVSMLGGIHTEEARVRMEFKRIAEKAGLGQDWTPREPRHTFVSLLSDSGVPIEQIADAVGHASTRTTEVVYRHQLRPVTRTAAIALGPLFESRGKTDGGQS
jgi:Phage integrase family